MRNPPRRDLRQPLIVLLALTAGLRAGLAVPATTPLAGGGPPPPVTSGAGLASASFAVG